MMSVVKLAVVNADHFLSKIDLFQASEPKGVQEKESILSVRYK